MNSGNKKYSLKILSQLLACPDCGTDLSLEEQKLTCVSCKRDFPIEEGIPILYPCLVDETHIEEENKLAGMMLNKPTVLERSFSLEQWAASKTEFWNIVKNHSVQNGCTYINIGCGYDEHFTYFQNRGNVIINFDLVKNPLIKLKKVYGADHCVAGDIKKLPFKKNMFDYVICIDVIHHEYSQVRQILSSIHQLLRPGGILFLQDPNAWGMFQFYKSIVLPKFLHQFLREAYHHIRKSTHRPAKYELPTNVWKTKSVLAKSGFKHVIIYPNVTYPGISRRNYKIYQLLSTFDYVKKYHNFHYTIEARKQ